ncbi:MAG: carbamate kinase [Firmicutes bacterium]|nr:carbamate kinase [Bacillota bacterium]
MYMTVVIALGGNALLRAGQEGTAEEQLANLKIACEQLVDIIRKHKVVLTHGNGPQVGKIVLQNEIAQESTPAMPFDVCGAMSQGQIGYMLQQQLKNEMIKKGVPGEVVTLITRVVVDKNDPSFQSPTKPIGSFYSEEEAREIMRKKKDQVWIEDAGRGWRRVVASPDPKKIVEKEVIKKLLQEDSIVLVASGGGGVPVIKEGDIYKGVEAVLDKDLSAELLAEVAEADLLLILTDVTHAFIHYGKPQQEKLQRVSRQKLEEYWQQGHFAKGSMEPKVRAALRFLQKGGKRAAIASLDQALEALEGKTGTQVVND